MSKVENIGDRIKNLTPEELAAFRDWFLQFDAEAWDRQLDSDAASGKLEFLVSEAENAMRDHAARRTTNL